MIFLEARQVVKQYANHLALNNVSLQVPEGSIYGLLGPNGAGKTTLIRIINQITGPDSGEVLLNGRKLQADDVHRIGYLPEERGLYKKMKVGEQAVYLARLKGLSRNDAIKKLKFWFEKFEIQAWWDKKVEELSKGMQQKIQFVVTVLHEPKLLIFDEPFSGFDPINANILKQEILSLKEQGATILFSTHNMGSVEELCDHITLINQSQAILSGEVHDIRQQYKDNLIKVDYSGEQNLIEQHLDDKYIIESISPNHHQNTAFVKMSSDGSVNNMIGQLLNHVEIHGLQEVLPTMNDIFIKVVEQSNQSKSENR
ncbi:ABC transporter ATP-binding protein [Carboxylicivirga sp. N1Y90]|uniref:ABC transporter ATP-binding protein n=1 Tax=Carboxylicivirga fragile TaxID=3417571 RepID=UPI003D32D2EF|nr:ATP-binding cassette domain-containing protein [Marinilabiliaceae bacterium N1Y90]